jgi:hypothetical protein
MPSPPCPPVFAYVGEDDSAYFRFLYGRKLNVLNTTYLLPVDDDEVKVSAPLPPFAASHLIAPPLSVQTAITVYFSLSSAATTT